MTNQDKDPVKIMPSECPVGPAKQQVERTVGRFVSAIGLDATREEFVRSDTVVLRHVFECEVCFDGLERLFGDQKSA
jgi:hypothetical protein